MRLFNTVFTKIVRENAASKVVSVAASPNNTKPEEKYDEQFVMRFIRGLRFIIRKRNTYFHSLLQKVPIVVTSPNDTRVKTMCVDAKGNLYINPRFASDLLNAKEVPVWDKNYKYEEGDPYSEATDGEKQFLGVIAHELMHIFKDHMARGDRFPQIVNMGEPVWLWNIATDIEINDELMYKWGYYLPSMGIITKPDGTYEITVGPNPKKDKIVLPVRNRSPERIHKMLLDSIPEGPPPPPGGGSGQPKPLGPGDIVYDKKTGKYGEIVSVKNGKAKIVEITEQEAKERTK